MDPWMDPWTTLNQHVYEHITTYNRPHDRYTLYIDSIQYLYNKYVACARYLYIPRSLLTTHIHTLVCVSPFVGERDVRTYTKCILRTSIGSRVGRCVGIIRPLSFLPWNTPLRPYWILDDQPMTGLYKTTTNGYF